MKISTLQLLFKRISRPFREQLLCAMIRVNYGTAWDGDLEILKNFFPEESHSILSFGGLTKIIEAFSPFTEDKTDSGILLNDNTANSSQTEATKTIQLDLTSSFQDKTSDLPLADLEKTLF